MTLLHISLKLLEIRLNYPTILRSHSRGGLRMAADPQ